MIPAASLRHVMSLSISDYYGRSVAMSDIQRQTHSLCRRSDLGNPRLALMLGTGFRVAFVPLALVLHRAYDNLDNPSSKLVSTFSYRRFQTDFLRPPGNGTENLRSAIQLIPYACFSLQSVVAILLRQLSVDLYYKSRQVVYYDRQAQKEKRKCRQRRHSTAQSTKKPW